MKLNKVAKYFFILFISFFFNVYGETKELRNVSVNEHSTGTLTSSMDQIVPGQPFWVMVQIDLKPGWHSYWKNPGDAGLPATLDWELPEGFQASSIHWHAPEIIKTGDVTSFGFLDHTYLLVKIIPPKNLPLNKSFTLKVTGEWLVCDDVCLMEGGTLTASVTTNSEENPSIQSAQISRLVKELPQPLPFQATYSYTDKEIFVLFPKSFVSGTKEIHFLPCQKDLIINGAPQPLDIVDNEAVLVIQRTNNPLPEDLKGVLTIVKKDNTTHSFKVALTKGTNRVSHAISNEHSFFEILLFAFLGGLILNTMPCVFPILSLKALTLTMVGNTINRRRDILHGLFYSAGVLVTFLGMAILILILQYGGKSVGWGFQMQSPVFVAAMAYLMFAIGLSLSGFFHMPLFFESSPLIMIDNESKEQKKLHLEDFMVGALAVVVATPCTAPFMGAAIGYTLAQPAWVVLCVFTSLAVGFALPYVLIALSTTIRGWLPRPGVWMENLKEFLAFPMYATVIWLVWVLIQQDGTGGFLLVTLGLLGLTFSIWIWKHIRPEKLLSRIILLVLLIILSISPLHWIGNRVHDNKISGFTTQKLEELTKNKKPVLVVATAAWCITCKVNEAVLKSDSVAEFLNEKGVIYLEADWTNQNKEIGSYLEKFGRRGVPLYVYYPADGSTPRVLPQILTEAIIRANM